VKPDTLLLLARRPRVFLGRRAYVLVLSHMRSYSSLLCHILGSHPEIAGYAEMHVAYHGGVDLLRARARVARSLNGSLPGRYVLDKVLHDEYAVAPTVLGRDDVYPIILLRRPIATIASVVAMGRDIVGVPWYSDVAQVTEYYARRVERLGQLANDRASPYLFVRAEEIVEQPERTLSRCERFLDLSVPLSESYSIFPRTGEVGSGDSSGAIRSGRILRERGRAEEPPLTDTQRERATRAYDDCVRLLEGGSLF
jgi:hypothetical protein